MMNVVHAQSCIDYQNVATTNPVGDLISDDDSIRLLRRIPSEHYGSELGTISKVEHRTRS